MPNHHQINYVELPGGDLGKTKAFYGGCFGWTFTDFGADYASFANAGLDGGFVGGRVSEGPGPLVILYSDALETSLETVTQHGGTISTEIFAFPGGRRFHFTDPAGNELAVWSDR